VVCTVRRYTGPLVLYSWTSSRNVCSPPVTAGNTTARTGSSGAPTHASAMANRMFSLPVTRLNAFTNSCTTRLSARAPMRCTVEISSSTRASVISRCRECSSAASRVSFTVSGCSRRCEGDSTAARARQPATTFGATPANRPAGRPTARTARSLRVSVSIESRLTLPGTDLISPKTESATRSSSSIPSTATRACSRSTTSAGIAWTMRRVSVCSAWCSADRTIRSTRFAAGGSIRSPRHRISSSSRTWSWRRSVSHTFTANHPVKVSASCTEHSRKPRYARICQR